MNPTQVNPRIEISFQTILNCFLRETGSWQRLSTDEEGCPEDFREAGLKEYVRIPLEQSNLEIAAGLRYWSLTGRHMFHAPVLHRSLSTSSDASRSDSWRMLESIPFLIAALNDAAARLNRDQAPELQSLVDRIRSSQANIDLFIREREADVERLNGPGPLAFIEAEQSLLIGHQLHPTAKSREGFGPEEMRRYSPELCGSFPLHFFHVHPDVLHTDSALPVDASQIVRNMLAEDESVSDQFLAQVDARPDWALLPVHPWQAQYVQSLPEVQELFAAAKLADLGSAGLPFTPTTSIRTVYREGAAFMFKFSLSVKITNSVRVSLTRELDRAVEMARLMQTPRGAEIQAEVPDFHFIQDPAYIAVRWKGRVLEPLSCILRDASFAQDGRNITSIAALVQDHPFGEKSRLFRIVEDNAVREGRSLEDAARDWFGQYLRVSIYNLLKLFFKRGLCFEAHGQNSLLEIKNGYPVLYLYRDSQGYFHRQASHADFCEVIPKLGESTESIFPEDLANERLVYYLIINQVFSMINAFGVQGLADERELLQEFARLLERIRAEDPRYPTDMIEHLLTHDRLPCKGNLLTQYFDMDELVGDIATQSVYVTIPNAIKEAL